MTTLHLYDTFSKGKKIFKSLKKKRAMIYTCGPTVYDYAHIGNFRSYIAADILKRYLEYSGYTVRHAKNITDVGHLTQDDMEAGEDKIIAAAKKSGKSPKDVAKFFTEVFFEDEKKFNIKRADYYPKATDYVKKMIKAVRTLIKKKYAYESGGSVFYDVAKFSDYGKLSGNTLEKLKKEARLEENPLKKNWFDFALWLKAPENHLMKWKSPWSVGYPGWHIECSVMSAKTLGDMIDIHTGGEDNVFPHHENEIAQSESLTNKKFVHYWLHTRHLLVDGRKMSKSEGNFYTSRDLEKRGFSPLAFRLLVLGSHYRNSMNFTWQALQNAQNALDGIMMFINKLREHSIKSPEEEKKFHIDDLIKRTREEFKKQMDDDLNTPRAVAVFFDFIKNMERESSHAATRKNARKALRFIKELDLVLGLNLKYQKQIIPPEIKKLAEEREILRKEKNWEKTDEIRKKIEEAGYIVEDMASGVNIRKK